MFDSAYDRPDLSGGGCSVLDRQYACGVGETQELCVDDETNAPGTASIFPHLAQGILPNDTVQEETQQLVQPVEDAQIGMYEDTQATPPRPGEEMEEEPDSPLKRSHKPESTFFCEMTWYPNEKLISLSKKGGELLCYSNVTEEVWNAFRDAKSAGRFYNHHIKRLGVQSAAGGHTQLSLSEFNTALRKPR